MKGNSRKSRYSAVAKSRSGGMSKFFVVVGSVVGAFLLVATVAAYGYVRQANAAAKPYLEHLAQNRGGLVQLAAADFGEGGQPLSEDDDDSGFLLPPRKTNVLIAGLDQGDLLTDTLMVGCFDRETKKLDLISIPRDTYVTLPRSMVQEMQQEGRKPPSSGVMKINSVNSYGGAENGYKYLEQYLEIILGIKIDYYALVDTKAFRKIVDDVGGVDMEIPAGGLHYYDPTQNFRINVPGGLVHLDGEMAEGVVRYRATYREADLHRIEVQHEFLSQLFSQVLSRENIINNAPSLLSTFISYVRTDFTVADAPKYLRYITSLKAENLSTHTLPGGAKYITASSGDNVSYFFHDEVETKAMVDRIFYSVEEASDQTSDQDMDEDSEQGSYQDLNGNSDEDAEETGNGRVTGSRATSPSPAPARRVNAIKDKDLKIQVLNGGIIDGMASKKRSMLENFGFTVAGIDTYTGTQKKQTRIVARDEETAQRLSKYFTNVVLEEDPNLSQNYDIVVVLGLDET